jgi:hypothetical protein
MAIAPLGVALVAAGATALLVEDVFRVAEEMTVVVPLVWAVAVPFKVTPPMTVGRSVVDVPLTRRVAVATTVDVVDIALMRFVLVLNE